MIHQDHLVVPKAAISGYDEIDSKNILIVELYNNISKVLEKKHNRVLLAKFTKFEDLICNNEPKEDVRAFRTQCFKIHRSVIFLGGVPLAEPVAYWRWKYNLTPF
ncbi:hypothetical protein PVAP13_7NG377100 [Panicum virgatum]|uniref:Uncharacterized protein n=1 Tax=Panicum virgatum TaxID=38727 RepID=A0A8T0Q7T0_PANVG|nr:hypothetical protein PVAP13_7NG377100 [Panicum virgatum]